MAVLPLEKYDYLSDFGTSESKDEFLRLLAGANTIVELPPQADRERGYEAAGVFIREQADVLLAVWDGQDGQGSGGTADMVADAREGGLPIAWVHEHGDVTYEHLDGPAVHATSG